MPICGQSSTAQMPLEAVTARLARHPLVDGLLLIGSAGQGGLTPASDIDLALVLRRSPVPLFVGVTWIEGRFTDLLFWTSAQVEQICGLDQPVAADSELGRIVAWLAQARIVYDATGSVQQAQRKAQAGLWIAPPSPHAGYSPWVRINYNLAVVRRYLASDDPDYLTAADVRMLVYGPADLLWGYFQIRGIDWTGEKPALAHLRRHDPDYLGLYLRFLAEAERQEKFRLYEELSARTVAPVGRLWQPGDALVNVTDAPATEEKERANLAFWQELLSGQPTQMEAVDD